MGNSLDTFESDFKDGKIRVQRYFVSHQIIYRVIFSDNRSPLVVTRAFTDSAVHWWTSIPEGRQREAEEIVQLIEKYLETQKRIDCNS
ncbi:MAG TPA: hypothetical protein VIL78_06750 [Hanamia sp.]